MPDANALLTALVRGLRAYDPDIAAWEIADVLLLASRLPYVPPSTSIVDGEDRTPHSVSADYGDTHTIQENREDTAVSKATSSGSTLSERTDLGLYTDVPQPSQSSAVSDFVSAARLRVPAGRALTDMLGIGRALRPLMRRVPSHSHYILDSDATAEHIATLRIAGVRAWSPILRPAPERWLALDLVVDVAATMVPWRETIDVLAQLLNDSGSFRTIRRWALDTDVRPGDTPRLARANTRQPQVDVELAWQAFEDEPGGSQLILVLTDCIGQAWHDGTAFQRLARWGERTSVALVQVLPERLWDRTALGKVRDSVRAARPGAPNRLLELGWPAVRAAGGADQEEWLAMLDIQESIQQSRDAAMPVKSIPIPVIRLERNSLAPWARLVAGRSGPAIPALLVEGAASPLLPINAGMAERGEANAPAHTPVGRPEVSHTAAAPETPAADPALQARLLVEEFRSASRTAQQLAVFFTAAAPLSLPVMRVVRDAMLPRASEEHIAEVLMSGLLKVSDDGADPVYTWLPGVREQLARGLPISDAARVVRKVSAWMSARAGSPWELTALTPDVTGTERLVLNDKTFPFARLTTELLAQFGPAFHDTATTLRSRIDRWERTNAPTGLELQHTLSGHQGNIFRLAWAPDGYRLATPSVDGTIRLWDAATGQLLCNVSVSRFGVNEVTWSPDGTHLAASCFDHITRVWSVSPDGRRLDLRMELKGHNSDVRCGGWSPEGMLLATGTEGGTVRLWDTRRWSLFTSVRRRDELGVNVLGWSPDGRHLAFGCGSGAVAILRRDALDSVAVLTTATDIDRSKNAPRAITALAWSPRRQLLAIGTKEGALAIWDPSRTDSPPRYLTGPITKQGLPRAHDGVVTALSFAHDESLLTSKGLDDRVRFWRCYTWELVAELEETAAWFTLAGMAWHPLQPILATLTDEERSVRLWKAHLDRMVSMPVVLPIESPGSQPGELKRGSTPFRDRFLNSEIKEGTEQLSPGVKRRLIYDAQHRQELPGRLVRSEGELPTGDLAVDEMYDGLGACYDFFWEVFRRHSLDGSGLALKATVHYGRNYNNGFWNGTQIAMGDGDESVFNRFTIALDVISSRVAQGIIQFEAYLNWQNQSGALYSSISDVFGLLVKQYVLRQPATEADWLVGIGLLTSHVNGIAIHSMSAPGTAYDDPELIGKDPQVAHMRDYVYTSEDNGGVHINSGIPNHAFYLAAVGIGGYAWEKIGRIWYETLCGSRLRPDTDFYTFAQLTILKASELFGQNSPEPQILREAWSSVGIDISDRQATRRQTSPTASAVQRVDADTTGEAEAPSAYEPEVAPSGTGRPVRFFISSRRSTSEDARLARFLQDGLEARGYEVFIGTEIRYDADWAAEIDRRIRWCDYIVVLLSAESVQSEMVQGEIRRAHRYRDRDGRPHILPVRVRFDGQLDYELDSYLARVQYARWQSNDDSTRILEELIAAAETPGAQAAEGIDRELSEPPPFAPQQPAPSIDPRLLLAPGGTIQVNSQFYIRRPADDRIEAAARRGGETVIIKGPRQVGKSSLMVRYLKACADAGRHFAFFDFQILNDQQLDDYPTLLTWIARSAARRLRVQLDTEPDIGTPVQLSHFIEDSLLPMVGGPITLAFDEADRVFGRPYQADFFSMLRLWHNQRAAPFSAWENVDVALVISTEPYLLIDSADRSPFNVAVPIELGPFSRQNLDELDAYYGGTLSAAQLDRLHQLLGGHPYLTRLAYFRLLVDPRMPFDELDEQADDISGPFGEHLRARLFWLGRKKELLGAFKQVINNQTAPNEDTYLRLRGAGLVVREGRKTLPANLLYARFFKQAIVSPVLQAGDRVSVQLRIQAGGILNPRQHIYIPRPEDDELFKLLVDGQYANVLTSRQTGKSSLVISTIYRLRDQGVRTAYVDLTSIGTPEKVEDYYKGLLDKITRDLELGINVKDWWHGITGETLNQQLMHFFRDVVAGATDSPAVVFLDEIDSTLKLDFTDDLFTALRAMYSERALVPAYERIAFCLVGVATPNELIKERRTTAYNVGRTLELRDFDARRDNLAPLATALSGESGTGNAMLARVLYWTDGHPYLTMRVALSMIERGIRSVDDVDRLIEEEFQTLDRVSSDVHFHQILRFIETRLSHGPDSLSLYQGILEGKWERDAPTLAHAELKLSGLVKRDLDGFLVVRNRIYARLFDRRWVEGARALSSC